MKYNISTNSAPKMPKFGRGTDCIKILLSQVSKDVQEPIVPMLFPIFGAHISGAEFQYPDLSWKEPCGMMAHLVAESGGNKGQLSCIVEALCRDFRQHDEVEEKKLLEWQKQKNTKGANKEKPVRPDVAFWLIHRFSFRQAASAVRSGLYSCASSVLPNVLVSISILQIH